MNEWNKLLVMLDTLFGFPDKAASKVKKLQQGLDNRTQEHVIWIKYRVRVNNAQAPSPDPKLVKASRAAGCLCDDVSACLCADAAVWGAGPGTGGGGSRNPGGGDRYVV